MLWKFTSWNHLKLAVPIYPTLHSSNWLFKNNYNMTANSVEKNIFQQYVEIYYSVVLNVKLVKKKMDSKRFINFWNCYILLFPWTPPLTRLVLLQIFVYSSNKCVLIYEPELNLLNFALSLCWFFKKASTPVNISSKCFILIENIEFRYRI